jgi:hypothetical protein
MRFIVHVCYGRKWMWICSWFSYVCGLTVPSRVCVIGSKLITVLLVVESCLSWLKGFGLAFVVYTLFLLPLRSVLAHTRI